MFKNEFIKHDGKLFIVKKIVKAEYNPVIETWKEHTGSDVALRRGDLIYFCETVPDAEEIPFVEDSCERV